MSDSVQLYDLVLRIAGGRRRSGGGANERDSKAAPPLLLRIRSLQAPDFCIRQRMPENYPSAAARHWNESAFLSDATHWQEAAYLAGYAAECALKTLVNLGGVFGRKLGHDLAALTGPEFDMAVLFNPFLRRLHSDLSTTVAAGLPPWSEEHRYEETGSQTLAEYQSIVVTSCGLARVILVNLTLDGEWEEVPL